MTRNRKGFTLVELLVVTVLGSLLLMAVYETLITNQRTYTVQAEQVKSENVLRAAMDLLVGEFRELEPSDVGTFSATDIRYRAVRRFGLVCDEDVGVAPPTLTVRKFEAWFESGENVYIFADNEENLTSDDAWLNLTVSAIDTAATCGGEPAQVLSFSGAATDFTNDSVRVGAPIRSWELRRLRKTGSGYAGWLSSKETSPVPLVGPLDLTFDYFDIDGNATTVAADIRSIKITLRTQSAVQTQAGSRLQDSLVTTVFLRN